MPPAEEDELTERLADRFVDVMGAIAAIDIEKAHASQPEDKRVIFEHINTTFGGAAKFNSQVSRELGPQGGGHDGLELPTAHPPFTPSTSFTLLTQLAQLGSLSSPT